MTIWADKAIDEIAKRMNEVLARESEYMIAKFMKVHCFDIDDVELVYVQAPDHIAIYPRKRSGSGE